MNNDSQNCNELSMDFKYRIFGIDDNEFIESILPLFPYDVQKKIITFMKIKKKLPISTDLLISKGYQKEQLGKKIKELTILWIDNDFVEENFLKNIKL